MKHLIKSSTIILLLASIACNNKPKVINSSTDNTSFEIPSGVIDELPLENNQEYLNKTTSSEFHKVTVKEVLPASQYMYLKVTEGDDTFWIASRSMKVVKGESYYYKGGLLKTNFESKEYDRFFDKIYLVSSLVAVKNHGNVANSSDYLEGNLNETKHDVEMHAEKVVHSPGSIKIAELVENPKKYEGETIQLDGVCTKINSGIMNRNWIHIKDGTKDDFDLVITSDTIIREGQQFTMKAVVVLNKDFGAGYIYDLILEKGELVK
jgi:hypothetical protein